MAAFNRNRQSGEHPFRTIVKLVRSASENSANWPRLMLLYGKEEYLTAWSVKYIRDALVDPATAALNYTEFYGAELESADDIIAACETVPMLAEKRMVVVRRADIFSLSQKTLTGDEIQKLAEYLKSLPSSTLLVFTARSADKRSQLYKAVSQSGTAYDFTPLDDETLAGWMSKRFKAAGRTASRSDMLRFAGAMGYGEESRGYDLYSLENDLNKAFACCDSAELSFDDMMGPSAPGGETDAFRLLDAAFSGNKGEAFTILHNTIDIQTPSKVQGALLSFLGLLCAQLEIMLEARERQEAGQDRYSIENAMGVNGYRLRKAMESSARIKTADLKRILSDSYEIDDLMRTGTMDPGLALEVFIGSL